MIFEMLFLTLSSANIDFWKKKLWLRSYIIEETFSITKQVELIEKKKFAAIAIDLGHEIFIVYIASLESPN